MKYCPEAPKAQDGKFATLFQNHIDVRAEYDECKVRHNTLVDRINELNED